MRIIHVATEIAPIAKEGGLGDVIFGLSQELIRKGHEVSVLLPKYDSIDIPDLTLVTRELFTVEGGRRIQNTLWKGRLGEITLFLLEPHHPANYFSRKTIYGCPDNLERFLYFSRASLDCLMLPELAADCIHLHDWPTAPLALLLKELHPQRKWGKIVLTLHNLEYQGLASPDLLTRLGVRGEMFLQPDKLQDTQHPHLLNFLKGGIEYADLLTTVSPNYENEILTKEGGRGLHELLQKHRAKLSGILNGIDAFYWDPAQDRHLHSPLLGDISAAKSRNRARLCERLGLKEARPLIVAISRLVHQKGPELIAYAAEKIVGAGGSFVLLGTIYDKEIECRFRTLDIKLKKTGRAVFHLEYDEKLAHLLFAAADGLVIPSLFEPCGLTQMIALRYGTLPIARATGGLSDTVFDIETSTLPEISRNGFTFDFHDIEGIDWALNRALTLFHREPAKWEQFMLQGMKQDFSWQRPAEAYVALYQRDIPNR